MKLLKLLLIAAIAVAPASSIAGNNGNGGAKGTNTHSTVLAPRATQAASSLITAAERALIFGYFEQNHATLPAPLAGAQPLPPGIARKVARGGSLPPGIAKRYLPNDLMGQLPPRPGYQWIVVGTDVILIAAATSIIVDVLDDVL
jgi:hypothetical protein